MQKDFFMDEAIALSRLNLQNHEGGPFGCVVVKEGRIVGKGYNKVLSNSDPTAHAEIEAIRDACKTLGTFQLDNCEIYTSCEPCPMCMGAIYWARPKIVYYGNTREDAAYIGFDDSMIYEEMNASLHERKIPMVNLKRREATEVFKEWNNINDKAKY